jgi:hypothetical protein
MTHVPAKFSEGRAGWVTGRDPQIIDRLVAIYPAPSTIRTPASGTATRIVGRRDFGRFLVVCAGSSLHLGPSDFEISKISSVAGTKLACRRQ